MARYRRYSVKISNPVLGAVALLLFFSLLLQSVSGTTYYSLVIDDYTLVSSPPVILQSGTAGTSIIYTNNTSAKVGVTAPANTEDYVDLLSNVDNSADIGTHSNFTAQKYGPDLINDTLTEENMGGSGGNSTLWLYVNADDENKTDWTRVGTNPYLDAVDYNANYTHVSGNNMLGGDFGFADSGKFAEGIYTVEVQLYAQHGLSKNLEVFVWNSSSWTSLGSIALANSWSWTNWTATTVLDSWTKIDAAKIYLLTRSPVGTFEVDCARLEVDYSEPEANYEVDLELQWTNADFDESYEELCIKTGTFSGSENIQIKVWNSTGSSWHWVMNLTASQWNNVSITSYLTSNTLTVQFLGGSEMGDAIQDSWEIDASLLHIWMEEWGTWSDELLVNPSFEMGNLTGWTAKGPAAASVEVFNATSGGDIYTNKSLRIGNYGVCTKDQPGTNDDSGVWQNVSLASYASAIDSENAVINATAWLYPSEWDWDDVALIIRFYNSSGGFITAWNTTGEYGSGSAYYPKAWMLGQGETHFTQGQLEKFGCYNYTIPVGTRTVGIHLGMGEHEAPSYCGGQADEASIKIRTRAFIEDSYDYVLRVNNTITDSWQIRLKKYSDSNISRLQNCTIYLHNSTDGISNQILVENGAYTQDVGPWYNLSSSATIYIAMMVEANSTGTSYVNVYLEILIPDTMVYAQYIITFEIT